MIGAWKCYGNVINGKNMYRAGRQLDTTQPLHSGNIEYRGGYIENKKAVEDWCEVKNAEDGYGKY